MKKIALLPIDARPVSYDLPRSIAKEAGYELVLPDKSLLGFLKVPAELTSIHAWIKRVAKEVDGIVLAIDMLVYGGLVPSRIHTESYDTLSARLDEMITWLSVETSIPVMALCSTMRLSNNNVNEEEKDYWAQYGEKIWQLSYHEDRFFVHGEEADKEAVEARKKEIPEAILEDYHQTRRCNAQLSRKLFDYVEEKKLRYVVFPQDDTAEYGFQIAEQRQLKRERERRKLFSQVAIYPGADEVSSVLTARLISELTGITPPTFYPIYSGQKGALSPAMYEDRPLMESVKGQIFAVGSHTVETPQEADVVLGVNVPGHTQGDLALRILLNGVDTSDRHIDEWLRKLRYYSQTKPVAIADVAYANGADEALIHAMLDVFTIDDLMSYAGWNTAGNTIGTVIAHATAVFIGEKIRQRKRAERGTAPFILHRLLDDYVYQTLAREEIRSQVKDGDAQFEQEASLIFLQKASEFTEQTGYYVDIRDVYFPWKRSFEVGFTVTIFEKRGVVHEG
ncbi:DUF4127 family protein [Paenalkalicoccus suaedae]|uniref:DUF4127 family protein n=1 Tax=Paenalkalicoccus suaedae TaxID=2592382 RepID=A0A859FIU3_9BACI|nr:DUF4127 family protein [Paenalkalicoccus suaedae]QKS72850.1 DUF4127 family protein [Paenalkalicoccus suaedae]